MKKIISIFSMIVILSLPLLAQETKEEPKKDMADKGKMMTMKGYVVDAACAKDMVGKDDMMEKAANHTKKCALNDMCAESGYGLFSNGKWYKFDEAGDKQAKDLIEKTTKTKEIAVEVKGKMTDGSIAVTAIKEQGDQKPVKSGKKMKKSKG